MKYQYDQYKGTKWSEFIAEQKNYKDDKRNNQIPDSFPGTVLITDTQDLNSENRYQLHKDYRRKNSPEFKYFMKRILEAVSPKQTDFKRKSVRMTVGNIFTPSNEAFALLFLYNDYNSWLNTTKGTSNEGQDLYEYLVSELEERREEQQLKELETEILKMYQKQNDNRKQQDKEEDEEGKQRKRKRTLVEILGEDDEDYKFFMEYNKNEQDHNTLPVQTSISTRYSSYFPDPTTTTHAPPAPATWAEFLQTKPTWVQSLLQNLNFLVDPEAIYTAYTTFNHLLVVSDGSGKDDTMAFAWVIASPTTKLVHGCAMCPGYQCSLRSEASGQLAALLFTACIQKYYKIEMPHMEVYCNSSEVSRRGTNHHQYGTPYPNTTTMTAQFDLTEQIYQTAQKAALQIQYKHVKGHQDDDPNATLSWEAELTVFVDKLADTCRQRHPAHVEYLTTRFHWAPHAHLQINWRALALAIQRIGHSPTLVKICNRILLTNATLAKWKYQPNHTCPLCEAPEDFHHLLQCPHSTRRARKQAFIRSLQDQLSTLSFDATRIDGLCSCLTEYLDTGEVSPTKYGHSLQPAISAQSSIDWDQMFMGHIVLEWTKSPDPASQMNHLQSGGLLTELCLRATIAAWHTRNHDVHGTSAKSILHRDRLLQQVSVLLALRPKVLPSDDFLFPQDPQAFLDSCTIEQLESFINNKAAAIRLSVSRASTLGLQDIRGNVMLHYNATVTALPLPLALQADTDKILNTSRPRIWMHPKYRHSQPIPGTGLMTSSSVWGYADGDDINIMSGSEYVSLPPCHRPTVDKACR
eukprot:jgi/Psemu1/5315/gm1.5315_g